MRRITEWSQWCDVYACLDVWQDEVRRICASHGLQVRETRCTFPGTHAVFFVNDDTVLKVFCPVRYNSYEMELGLHNGPLRDHPIFPSVRFHGTSPSGYDYIAFTRLGGRPVREVGRTNLSEQAPVALAQGIAALQADTRCEGDGPSGPTCLVHYDLTEDHVYVDDTGTLAGIIDFGDAKWGHPAEEFPVLFVDCLGCDDTLIATFRTAYDAASAHYRIDTADVADAMRRHPFGRDMVARLTKSHGEFARTMLAMVADRQRERSPTEESHDWSHGRTAYREHDMSEAGRPRLVPYDMVSPGWEAVYTGEKAQEVSDSTDAHGNVIERWSLYFGAHEKLPPEEPGLLDRMQAELGPLDEKTRQVRAHIASLTPCDSGVPTTIDELLEAIGRGELRGTALRNGCDRPGMCMPIQSSQPRQLECLRTIHDVVTGRLAGQPLDAFVAKYPHAEGFIRRTYLWLLPQSELSDIQKLLVERMFLPFGFFLNACKADPPSAWPDGADATHEAVHKDCYEEGGRGAAIDAQIERLAGLPKISMKYPQNARQAEIDDPAKMDLYILCCSLAHGMHTLCDCHHSAFRWIENWIYAVGTGRWGIPTRQVGTERERINHLLFGYALAIDKWLVGIPMQFLLLDLGHVDLGFDPKNEILRVYAHLGAERTPTKTWLAGSLWMNLMYNNAGLRWRDRPNDLLERAAELGISVREWMDRQLASQ